VKPRPRPSRPAPPRSGPLPAQPLCPDPKEALPAVYLRTPTPHQTIFQKRIAHVDPSARPGDWVAVYHSDSELLGYGLYNPRSEIAVRMIRWGEKLPDEAYWDELLDTAIALRRDLLKLDEVTDAYRVIHAESDGFPGLVVDRYGDTLSAEAFSVGMFQRAEALLARLAPKLGCRHTIVQTSPQSLPQEGFLADAITSPELPRQVTTQEFGTRFRVRFEGGHKTGFFCDQRDNRKLLAQFCPGKTVLDLCCYTGGFAVQAKKLGNAADVIGVDLDEKPLELARENANLNQVRCKFVQADAFAYMRDMLQTGRRFDVVVLDPPKLIRSRAELEEGTRKHFDLNRLAMQLVKPGGMLLSCTCAGLLPNEEFLRLLYNASRQAGPLLTPATATTTARHAARTIQVLFRTGAAADHPVGAHCPETEYLHAVWMRLL
jgi:23S rRNA (cytosine1962-C5)-methyltransferase